MTTDPQASDGACPPQEISVEEVRRVAALARLALPPEAIADLASDLASMLSYVAQLETVNTDGVEPTTHAVSPPRTLRSDEPAPGISREVSLSLAPEPLGGGFGVPKIID